MQSAGQGNHSKPIGITKNKPSPTKSFSSNSSDENQGVKAEVGDGRILMAPSPPVTPIRKLPGRKARVTSFKDLVDEDEDDAVEKADEGSFVEFVEDADE